MQMSVLLSSAALVAVLGLPFVSALPSAVQEGATQAPANAERTAENAQETSKSPKETPESQEEAPVSDEAAGKLNVNVTTNRSDTQPKASPEQVANESAIVETVRAFLQAYCAADAKAVASRFAPDAEYVDEHGNVLEGRQAIEESLTAFFEEHPGCELEIDINSLRFVGPSIAIEDGVSSVILKDDSTPVRMRYTAVYSKIDDNWLIVSVRDHDSKDLRQHRAQLEQLNWLIGDWVDESDDAVVTFSCQPDAGGKFLIREFHIQIDGQETMSGTQRIGWDPLSGKLRTWIFDSEGGFGEGFWHRHGDNWMLKLTGVTADGEPASMTGIYTVVNSQTINWQSVDHEVAGTDVPDSEVITVVRTSPSPELTELNQ